MVALSEMSKATGAMRSVDIILPFSKRPALTHVVFPSPFRSHLRSFKKTKSAKVANVKNG